MSDWKPGTVAKATVRGVPDVTVFRFAGGDWALDREIEPADSDWMFKDIASDCEVTDVRPLVVLDLDEAYVRMLPQFLRRLGDREQSEDDKPGRLLVTTAALRRIADQIEAQTQPPRIPEPAMYGIVTGHIGEGGPWKFVRSEYGWVCLDDGAVWAWETIVAPVLVREGVES